MLPYPDYGRVARHPAIDDQIDHDQFQLEASQGESVYNARGSPGRRESDMSRHARAARVVTHRWVLRIVLQAVDQAPATGMTVLRSTKGLILLPELRPGLAWATAHKDVGMLLTLLVLNAIRITVMSG